MKELLAHAALLGVSVHCAHIEGPQRGYYDSERKMIVYEISLTPVEKMCVLAHELGHAYYGHKNHGDEHAEELADYYAACLLITPAAYALAESIDPSPEAIAEELDVEPRLVRVYEKRALTRIGDVTYVKSRMGARQFMFRASG